MNKIYNLPIISYLILNFFGFSLAILSYFFELHIIFIIAILSILGSINVSIITNGKTLNRAKRIFLRVYTSSLILAFIGIIMFIKTGNHFYNIT